MAQVLKPEVRGRIEAAALECFARLGYEATTVARIAERAGVAAGNVYRYVASKEALFAAVLPADLPQRLDALLDQRIAALAEGSPARRAGVPAIPDPHAEDLLGFWLDHRLAVVVLLDRAEGTPYAAYPAAFVRRMVDHVEATLGFAVGPTDRAVLDLVFDNTRRALARILLSTDDRDEVRRRVAAFWSYQVPGLDGLLEHLRAGRAVPVSG